MSFDKGSTRVSYDPDNAFAKILRGELPATKVCENAHALAFMDIMPQADGHVLVIPKAPAATIFELSEQHTLECIKMTRHVAIAVKVALEVEGLLIAQVNGAAAGQTVAHVHFHVIPRSSAAGLRPHGAAHEDPAKLRRLADRIIAALPAAATGAR